MKPIDYHEGKKYLRTIHPARGGGPPIEVDVYCVLEAFSVTCPARQHAIKKLLCAGIRDKGSQLDDLIGADAALSRAIDLQRLKGKPEWSILPGVNVESVEFPVIGSAPTKRSPTRITPEIELEVLKLMNLGKSRVETARILGLHRDTVGRIWKRLRE